MQIWIGAILTFILADVAWPLLTLPAGANWSKGYFRFTIVLAFVIALSSSCIAIFLPLWEGRHEAFDFFNWCLNRDVKPYGEERKLCPSTLCWHFIYIVAVAILVIELRPRRSLLQLRHALL